MCDPPVSPSVVVVTDGLEEVPLPPLRNLPPDLRALLVRCPEVNPGPHPSADDLVDRLRQAREAPRQTGVVGVGPAILSVLKKDCSVATTDPLRPM